MAKQHYLPPNDALFSNWLTTFASKIGAYAAKYGITAAEVTYISEAAAYFAYWFAQLAIVDQAKQNLTKFKTEIRKGVKAGGSPSVQPADITFAAVPASVPPGVEATIRSIVARIKSHQSYTTADGEQLGIEGDETIIDINTLKPVFTIELLQGHPNLKWKKGITDGVKIKVLRGAFSGPGAPGPEAFQFLAIDTQPDYLDTFPLPPFGSSVTWVYVMIYMIGDEEVGNWSDPVFINVPGIP